MKKTDPMFDHQVLQTRRQFFGDVGLRFGGIAMASMMTPQLNAQTIGSVNQDRVHPPLPGLPHFPGKAKSVIYLHMNGGPSQLDTWDYKPNLVDQFEKDLPKDFLGDRITTMTSGQAKFPHRPSMNLNSMGNAAGG